MIVKQRPLPYPRRARRCHSSQSNSLTFRLCTVRRSVWRGMWRCSGSHVNADCRSPRQRTPSGVRDRRQNSGSRARDASSYSGMQRCKRQRQDGYYSAEFATICNDANAAQTYRHEYSIHAMGKRNAQHLPFPRGQRPRRNTKVLFAVRCEAKSLRPHRYSTKSFRSRPIG